MRNLEELSVVRVVFDGTPHVHYGFVAFASVSDGDFRNGTAARRGQANGLCAAKVPGELHMVTALHTGPIGFRIEVGDDEPTIDDSWDEVVEVSYTAGPDTCTLAAFEWWHELHTCGLVPGRHYRARFSGRNIEEAHRADSIGYEAPPIDHYLLQFWPDDRPRDDSIVRDTTDWARYWHRVAQGISS